MPELLKLYLDQMLKWKRQGFGIRIQGTEDGKNIEDERVVRLENLGIKSNLRILNYKNFEELS